jgi:hypothetical protein
LERLADVMQKKRIDNENKTSHLKKSLGDDFKREQLTKITAENYRLLKKIQNVEPTYNSAKWEEEAKLREAYIRNISEFPDQYKDRKQPDYDIGQEIMASRPISTRGGRIRPLSI